MADYVSSLTGVAMDAALLDMAEHTSEAYAIGERNGVPVDSSDVTYHNNARYYASQAQSIAPASVTEAVRWDIAQTALTDAQREQARDNIEATSHNENLCDNAWFSAGNVVNSRGIAYGTVINGSNYGIDRWIGVGNGYTLSATGITVAAGASMVQRKDWSSLAGKTVTISAMGSNGTIGTWTGTFVSGQFTLSNGMGGGTIVNTSQINTGGSGVEWKAIKLELGSFSTLAQDTPPDYGEALTRCIYSTADPTDTYANNGFGRTNPNLLDNPWFGSGEVINQRSVTSGTVVNATYFIDRWMTTYGSAAGTYSLGSNGITLSPASGTSITMYQKLANASAINGKAVTASVLLSDGTIYSGTVKRENGTIQNYYYANGIRIRQVADNGLHIDVTLNAGYTIRAAKLELGTISTLANDVAPDYGTELAKCQRYFVRLKKLYSIVGTGYALNATTSWFFAPTPVPLRDGVALTSAISGLYVAAPSGFHAVSAIAIQNSGTAYSAGGVFFNATTTGLSSGEVCMLQVRDGSGYLDFSADL